MILRVLSAKEGPVVSSGRHPKYLLEIQPYASQPLTNATGPILEIKAFPVTSFSTTFMHC